MKEIIKKYIKAIIIISVLLLICDFLSALPPYIIKKVVDIDFGRDDIINTILFFICIYTSIHLARVIFKYIRDVFINTKIQKTNQINYPHLKLILYIIQMNYIC